MRLDGARYETVVRLITGIPLASNPDARRNTPEIRVTLSETERTTPVL
jgi:hypothetical protein